MSVAEANTHAAEVLRHHGAGTTGHELVDHAADRHEVIGAVGTGLRAAVASFSFFATGALIPVLPYLFGLQDPVAVVVAAALVGLMLLVTGMIVGLLSGAPPLRPALRQPLIGYGATITYVLGLLVGAGHG